MTELYLHSAISFHGVVINSLSTGTDLPYLYTPLINVIQLLTRKTLSEIRPNEVTQVLNKSTFNPTA
jgi:hypothetical protein